MTSEAPLARVQRPPRTKVAGLRTATLVTLVLGLGGGLLGWVVEGREAALGAVLGALVVGLFFVFSLVVTNLVAALAPGASMLVAVLTYGLQVALLALLYVAVDRADPTAEKLDPQWLGGVVIVGTLLWVGILLVLSVRERVPLYHVESHGVEPSTDGHGQVGARG